MAFFTQILIHCVWLGIYSMQRGITGTLTVLLVEMREAKNISFFVVKLYVNKYILKLNNCKLFILAGYLSQNSFCLIVSWLYVSN